VHIPKFAQRFTVNDINTTSGEVSATNVSDTSTTLTVDKWKGTAFYISDFQAKQIHNKYNVLDTYARDMAHDLAKQVDSDIWGYTAATYITNSVGDSATDILATSLEKAISIIESNSIPLNECFFAFHPKAYWREVMANSKLVEASKYGRAVLPNPPHNELYGIPVWIAETVPAGAAGTEGGHRNLLGHPEAIAFALQLPIRLHEKQSEHLRRKVIGDVAYGAINLRDAGVRIISNN